MFRNFKQKQTITGNIETHKKLLELVQNKLILRNNNSVMVRVDLS